MFFDFGLDNITISMISYQHFVEFPSNLHHEIKLLSVCCSLVHLSLSSHMAGVQGECSPNIMDTGSWSINCLLVPIETCDKMIV